MATQLTAMATVPDASKGEPGLRAHEDVHEAASGLQLLPRKSLPLLHVPGEHRSPRPKGESLATSTASSRSWTGGAYSTRAGVRDRGREWRVAPSHGRPEAGVDLACLESVGGTTTGETIDAHHFA